MEGLVYTTLIVCYVRLLCYHFDNKFHSLLIPSVLFSLLERKMECTKTHDPPEMVAEFYAVPHFQVHKKV